MCHCHISPSYKEEEFFEYIYVFNAAYSPLNIRAWLIWAGRQRMVHTTPAMSATAWRFKPRRPTLTITDIAPLATCGHWLCGQYSMHWSGFILVCYPTSEMLNVKYADAMESLLALKVFCINSFRV